MLNPVIEKALFFAVSLLVAFSLSAGEMYKWQDEDGVWHFSSTPPKSAEQFDTVNLPVDPRPMVTMRKLGINREPEYAFFNNIWGPVELELKLSDAENVTRTAPSSPLCIAWSDRETSDENKSHRPWRRFQLPPFIFANDRSTARSVTAEVDYYPPFPLGLQFPISQGFDNDETHSKPPNQYAVDIVMPVGTPILAARGGVVMDLQENFQGGGKQKRYLTRANQVRILHDDGTMAVYAHLQRNSVRVQRGARVASGHWIANSGNTGYSGGPHLHFVVQLNAGMSLESLPFRFVAPAESTMTPGERMMIDGVLPKK